MSRVCTGDSSQWDMSKASTGSFCCVVALLWAPLEWLNSAPPLWERGQPRLGENSIACIQDLILSELVTVSEAGDADQLVHWKLCFYTQLSLHLHHWSLSLLYISLKLYSCTSSWRALHSDRSFHSKHRNTKSIIFFSLNKKSHPINCLIKVHENPKHTVFVVCGVSDIFYWFRKLNLLTPSVTYLI